MADLTTTVWLSSQPPPPLGFLPLSANSSLQTTSLNTPTQPPLHSLEALYYHAESQQGSRSVVLDNLPKLPPSLSPAAPADQLTAAPVVHSASSTLAWNSPPATARPSRAASSRPAAPASALAAVASPSPTAAPSFREDISTRLLKRWEGWETETSTLYVTATDNIPTAVTVWETYGESPVVDGGTTTITEYQGDSTLTVAGPTYITLTFYPTTTTYHTERTTIPTSTKTKTSTQPPRATQTVCWPGDSSVKERTGLKPTHDQSVTLYVIAIYLVGIGIAWNLIGFRELLYPYKSMVIGFHEVGHVLSLICLGGSVGEFIISPDPGGQTLPFTLDGPPLPLPLGALPLGYLFNIFIGGLLTFCGFNTLASKIASFILAFCWLGVFFASSGLGKGMTILAGGLMVGLWWADHAWGLRFYVLFIGVMSSFYVLWDVIDDAFFAKKNPCCPAQFTLVMPAISIGIYTLIWFFISFIFFIGFVLAGLATWKESHHAMFCQAQAFLPT